MERQTDGSVSSERQPRQANRTKQIGGLVDVEAMLAARPAGRSGISSLRLSDALTHTKCAALPAPSASERETEEPFHMATPLSHSALLGAERHCCCGPGREGKVLNFNIRTMSGFELSMRVGAGRGLKGCINGSHPFFPVLTGWFPVCFRSFNGAPTDVTASPRLFPVRLLRWTDYRLHSSERDQRPPPTQ